MTVVDCVHLDENTNKLLAVVNIVMNPRVL